MSVQFNRMMIYRKRLALIQDEEYIVKNFHNSWCHGSLLHVITWNLCGSHSRQHMLADSIDVGLRLSQRERRLSVFRTIEVIYHLLPHIPERTQHVYESQATSHQSSYSYLHLVTEWSTGSDVHITRKAVSAHVCSYRQNCTCCSCQESVARNGH